MVTIGGRTFTSDVLERITRTVDAEPAISRRQLSLRVCEWLDWRNAAGRLQEMSCRKAMLQLERKGLIRLPVVTKRYAFQGPRKPTTPPPIGAFDGRIADLGLLEIVPVTSQQLSALWRGMMDAHHYLGSGPLCGAQLRYLVRSERAGWIGGASYSASARRVACRDAWIGWTEEALRANRNLVVNNSRFLIAPSVKVPNLASHVLTRLQRRLADDWERAYAYRPVVMETYVEQDRFPGTCYLAAGWSLLGTTAARGRQGTGTSTKRVFVQPLVAGWQQALCRTPDGTVVIRDRLDRRPPRNWIEAELGAANLGDARLTARLLEMTGRFYDQPTANIPQACGSAAEAKAAYRFLDNEAVQWNEILKPHFQATPASGPDPRRPRGTNGTSGRSKRRRAAGGSRATVRSVPCRIGVARHGSSSWPTGRATSTTCSSSGRSTGMPPICSSGSKADPIEWLLLSTVPVDSKADAFERLDWYARRWAIEVYHRILKSGCRVERRQLATASRLSNCLAIDLVVAWRIHHLTMLGQDTPDVPCTVYFTDSEWKALTTFVTRKKEPPPLPPSLNEAVRLLGKLGGHLGRKGDGEPGSEVLWRGMARLTDIEYAYSIYH
jgi:hypothetical protein